MKKMIKKIVTVFICLLMMSGTMKAQIYIADDDQGYNLRSETEGFSFILGEQGSEIDQFTPLGEGLLLFVGLGGAYLLKKRHRKE